MNSRRSEQYHMTPDGVSLAIDICEKAIVTFQIIIDVLKRDIERAANRAFASVDPDYLADHLRERNSNSENRNQERNQNNNSRRQNRNRRNNSRRSN